MNNSHTNSAPAMPSDPVLDLEVEPACSTWSVSITIIPSLVLALRIVGIFLALGVDGVKRMELEGDIRVGVGDMATDEELPNEEVGSDEMLVAVVSVLDDVVGFGFRLYHS